MLDTLHHVVNTLHHVVDTLHHVKHATACRTRHLMSTLLRIIAIFTILTPQFDLKFKKTLIRFTFNLKAIRSMKILNARKRRSPAIYNEPSQVEIYFSASAIMPSILRVYGAV